MSIPLSLRTRALRSGIACLLAFLSACERGADRLPEDRVIPDAMVETEVEAAFEKLADPELEPFTGDLDEMRERRLLRALVVPSRTDFFVDGGEIRGMQAELLRKFAAQLNAGVKRETEKIRIKYVPVAFAELLPGLESGRGDLAAAFLTKTPKRAATARFARPFRKSVKEIVVTHSKHPPLSSLDDLAGQRVYVLRDSSYVEHLEALSAALVERGLDAIEIEQADSRFRSEDVLEFVNAGIASITVVDSYLAKLWSRILDQLVVYEDLAIDGAGRVGWAVRRDAEQLAAAADAFVAEAREGKLLGNLLFERYFSDTRWIQDPTAASDRDNLRRYLGLFQKYGDRYDFDPLALAAQAYQESGLEQQRESPDGAVGLMQVLPRTAADPKVDIPDIDDPEGNVHAGTKYLAFIRDHYFDDPDISDWNRRALAWASYNAGPAKIRRARKLARQSGLDPDVWYGNVELAIGKIVGRETVRYVDNIHRYFVAYRLLSLTEAERRAAGDVTR